MCVPGSKMTFSLAEGSTDFLLDFAWGFPYFRSNRSLRFRACVDRMVMPLRPIVPEARSQDERDPMEHLVFTHTTTVLSILTRVPVAGRMRSVLLVLLFGPILQSAGPISEASDPGQKGVPSTSTSFSHEIFDRVLAEHVDEEGGVDYAGLSRSTGDLDRYVHLLGVLSPESHPERFPAAQDRMAYWINAYNAFVLTTVVEHYPTESVLTIKRWRGFFWMFRFFAGDRKYTLREILNHILRVRFQDPRIHFVLNCGARSAPPLEARAFTGGDLDERLERAAYRFISDARHVRIDRDRRKIELSPIFDWYDQDFRTWYMMRFNVWGAGILDYVTLYLSREDATYLAEHPSLKIEYRRYDWHLNDRSSSPDRTSSD